MKQTIKLINSLNEAKHSAKSKQFDLWKSQIDQKTDEQELIRYLKKLYKQLANHNTNNNNVKSGDFYDILEKINYIENKTGTKPKIGRILH